MDSLVSQDYTRRYPQQALSHSSNAGHDEDVRKRSLHDLRSIAPKSTSECHASSSSRLEAPVLTSDGTPGLSPTSDNQSLSSPPHTSPWTPPDAAFQAVLDPTLMGPGDHLGTHKQEQEAESSTQGSQERPGKKQRAGRGRVRIELAPDQPPTTQGKERERVYVACLQCRSRKIRCNGEKPACYNCRQRASNVAGAIKGAVGSPEAEVICVYDAVPKRRGPDKQPGARHRASSQSQPSKRKNETAEEDTSPTVGEPGGVKRRQRKRTHATDADATTSGTDRSVPNSAAFGEARHEEHVSHLPTSSIRSNSEEYPHEVFTGSHLQFSSHPLASRHSRLSIDSRTEQFDLREQHLSSRSLTSAPAHDLRMPNQLQYGYSHYPSADHRQELSMVSYAREADTRSNAHTHRTVLPSILPLTSPIDPQHSTRLVGSPSTSSASAHSADHVLPPHSFLSSSLAGSGYAASPTLLAPIPSSDYGVQAQSSLGFTSTAVQPTMDPRNPYSFLAHNSMIPSVPLVGGTDRGTTISEVEGEERRRSRGVSIAQPPSLDFTRKTWWDALIEFYASPFTLPHFDQQDAIPKSVIESLPPPPNAGTLTMTDRTNASRSITSDLQFLFRASNFWFAFIHVPMFFSTYCNSAARTQMQPSLVLAGLAMSTLLQSSELGKGHAGRIKALWLRDRAQAAMDASINAGWLDLQLAQAAWLLAMFECCAHPMQSDGRAYSALSALDNIIRLLALTLLDAQDPNACAFHPGKVPQVASDSEAAWPTPLYSSPAHGGQASIAAHTNFSGQTQSSSPSISGSQCPCESLSLAQNWPLCQQHTPLWGYTPAWNSEWSETQLKQEECRRLCWNTLTLITGYTSYATTMGPDPGVLYLMRPENYRLLLPGENLSVYQQGIVSSTDGRSQFSKETVWALYARAMLLWNSCVRMRCERVGVNDHDRAQFTNAVWLEAEAIEDALNRHKCSTERAFLFQGREYLFNARMYISYEYRRFVPYPALNGMFHRKKAEEWLRHQSAVAQRVMQGLASVTGQKNNVLAQRPFYVHWFMSQIARCLQLWSYDHSLTIAVELSKSFLPPIDYLTAIWPSEEQRRKYKDIRTSLEQACISAGLSPPAPPSNQIPVSLL